MKVKKIKAVSIIILMLIASIGYAQETYKDILETAYVAIDKEVYDDIVAMDKTYFDAYNNCDMEKQASLYSEDLEFFHDKGGLSTSKQEVLTSIEKNICGKVTRTLIEDSIEVYPIKGYGAIEIGYHKFYNNQEPTAKSKPSKFIMVWKKEGDKWKISKVISLH
ncbi:nuclear transport factor 2 family protein [Lutimonas halocynthiae]|uniref:nuclear transport factor 2 family protein n=1 Tax=Lutimonas halocynthiae TaxID=1446477 RepID=UPI0025B530B5|nr:nuclear transport factor 2 family protein [Lutimonas halocynthiae]MDN3643242.1 nuclear transport factor 2 family protein [Lutimonas halocynthiae]